MKKIAILGGVRVPFTRSFQHYSRIRNQEMLTHLLRELAKRYRLEGEEIGDVAFGGVMNYPTDWNLAREAVLGSTLKATTPAYNVQRACGTSMEASWQIGLKIAHGQIESGIAGGSDTNSDVAITWRRSFAWKLLDIRNAKSFGARLAKILALRPGDFVPNFPVVLEPRTGLSMGEHCELMVKEWKIGRREQDELSVASHAAGAAAWKAGFYDDLVAEFRGLKRDTILREDTTLEKMARLKPAFDRSPSGTLTAGNSTSLSDGAAIALLGSEEYARKKGLAPLAYLVDAETAAVDFVAGEGLLIAPTVAVARLLARNNLKLQDFDCYEIHEAFAGQVLCTLKAWESREYCGKKLGLAGPLGSIDRAKMNQKGGSLALGHPFGATGARILVSLAKQLRERGGGRGLISICTAGGMGIAAIVEA